MLLWHRNSSQIEASTSTSLILVLGDNIPVEILRNSTAPNGRYIPMPMTIYQWRRRGLRDESTVAIAMDAAVATVDSNRAVGLEDRSGWRSESLLVYMDTRCPLF